MINKSAGYLQPDRCRQTFKELSPIQQQDFLGGDVFIGNSCFEMSALENYDLRTDYTPYEGDWSLHLTSTNV